MVGAPVAEHTNSRRGVAQAVAPGRTRVARAGSRRPAPPVECCSVLVEPITGERAADLATAFAALGDPVRMRLFSMIAAAGTACSCELIEPIGKSQPTVSHHTKVLADAGLITGAKAGRWVNWTVVPEKLEQLRAALASA